uniref:Uncharacterized protein n=1 Tax=Acrobeloides nanus TaxID=290746 RepID=A0A914CGN5_9BILA
MKVKTLTCSNITVAVKTHNCVLGTQLLQECVAENCKTELKELSKAVEERAQQGEHVIPGKQFCSLDSCSRKCMKKILPMSCGEESFSLYTNINDMANIVQSLTLFETKPSSENGILCIDRPIPGTTGNYENDK